MPLTERQREIYQYIVKYRRSNGCSPSIPELQQAFDIRSPNGVVGHLNALVTKGYIRRAERGSRQIEVLGPGGAERGELYDLPVYGHIPAGPPQRLETEPAEGCATLDAGTLGFRPREGCFVLRVRGDSMRDAGILSGDMVVVQPTPSPRAGQIVAALIDGDSTLKRLLQVNGRWFLKAENPAYPQLLPREDLVIQGVVRAVVRKFDA
jgi:repressor LexA